MSLYLHRIKIIAACSKLCINVSIDTKKLEKDLNTLKVKFLSEFYNVGEEEIKKDFYRYSDNFRTHKKEVNKYLKNNKKMV